MELVFLTIGDEPWCLPRPFAASRNHAFHTPLKKLMAIGQMAPQYAWATLCCVKRSIRYVPIAIELLLEEHACVISRHRRGLKYSLFAIAIACRNSRNDISKVYIF